MTFSSIAEVPTQNAARYLNQLCKHWAHTLDVELNGDVGRIEFPADARGANWPAAATVTLTASDNALTCRIDSSATGQLDGLKGALSRHLDRFAFREAPLPFNWRDQ